MQKPARDLFAFRESIKKGDLTAINRAQHAGVLNDLMFDIVENLTFKTSSMLSRAATFKADFKQCDGQGNTLLHVLAKSEVQVIHTEDEKYVSLHSDYYHWAIRELLTQGLSFEKKNDHGQTPMDIATQCKNLGFSKGRKLLEAEQKRDHEMEKSLSGCYIS